MKGVRVGTMPRASSVFASHHAVKFYPNDASLFTTVGRFVSQGLVGGQPAVLIATESHLIGILNELRGRYIDVDRAVDRDELIVLDARQTLDRFMIGNEPDPTRFADTV